MASPAEVLAFGCREDDLAVLREAFGPTGSALSVADSPVEVARRAAAGRPAALFLGVGRRSMSNLDVITLIEAVRRRLPVIVIADEDSLELERRARQRSIFYYLVHPIQREEVEAVLRDVARHPVG